MPGRSGIHVGAELMQKNVYVKIIIITSFPDYLDEAMNFHVYRYLSKPIDENRFCRSLSAALKQLHMETVYIHVCTVDGGLKLRADEIICVERRKNKGSFAKKAEAFTRFTDHSIHDPGTYKTYTIVIEYDVVDSLTNTNVHYIDSYLFARIYDQTGAPNYILWEKETVNIYGG